jgi:hypothetical protein
VKCYVACMYTKVEQDAHLYFTACVSIRRMASNLFLQGDLKTETVMILAVMVNVLPAQRRSRVMMAVKFHVTVYSRLLGFSKR